jgi:hypothetical protein
VRVADGTALPEREADRAGALRRYFFFFLAAFFFATASPPSSIGSPAAL